jgi:hypothetical protein
MNIVQTRDFHEDRIRVVVTVERDDLYAVYDQPSWSLVRQLLREAEKGDGVDALFFLGELGLLLKQRAAERKAQEATA